MFEKKYLNVTAPRYTTFAMSFKVSSEGKLLKGRAEDDMNGMIF